MAYFEGNTDIVEYPATLVGWQCRYIFRVVREWGGRACARRWRHAQLRVSGLKSLRKAVRRTCNHESCLRASDIIDIRSQTTRCVFDGDQNTVSGRHKETST